MCRGGYRNVLYCILLMPENPPITLLCMYSSGTWRGEAQRKSWKEAMDEKGLRNTGLNNSFLTLSSSDFQKTSYKDMCSITSIGTWAKRKMYVSEMDQDPNLSIQTHTFPPSLYHYGRKNYASPIMLYFIIVLGIMIKNEDFK